MKPKRSRPYYDEDMQQPLLTSSDPLARIPLRYEQLIRWAAQEWEHRYSGKPHVGLWASENCASNRARQRIKSGRKMKGNARYAGWQSIDCPYVAPISQFVFPGRKVVLTESVGAFIFSFASQGETFDVLYVNGYYEDRSTAADAVALVPPDHLEAWASFQEMCDRNSNHLERSQKAYIIGGTRNSFTPNVEWEQIILSETLKTDLRSDVETFFSRGVAIYRELGLPPFRKLLLVGPPGTGKSTLCAALAKLALQRKCVVVYVSAADDDGASFDKIHNALNIVADSRHPVLLIVEELDAYLAKEDKSQILNVLDGLETPNNTKGALLVATTNYPEIIDERIAKRPGRMDRIVYIPPIQDEDQALRMLTHYMGAQWQEEHRILAVNLIGQTGAFVREMAVYARLLAADKQEPQVSLAVLQKSFKSLTNQLATGDDLMPRRPIGFGVNGLKSPVKGISISANQIAED